ncbi:hypothetical protein KM043_001211 [Ampulex compressa]|nr:hypothetical protein KM043_001211 [Ampulex compressa]
MFRIGFKFPCNGLNRVKKHGCCRLYLTARYHEARGRLRCEPEGRLIKDVKLMSRYSGLKYSTESPRSERPRGSKALVTLGAVTLGTLGVLSYAKSNEEFRATLEGWIPGTDKTIRLIFSEDSSYFDFIRTFFETLKQTVLKMMFGDATEKKPVAEKPLPPTKEVPEELKPSNLVDLETRCGELASKAIAAYHTATCAIQDYNQNVLKVVEGAGTEVSGIVWESLKEATEKRKQAVKEAEQHATEAAASLKRMYSLIDEPNFEAPSHMKSVARRNVKKILDDVDTAKSNYDKELQSGNLTERYWQRIKAARETFNEELRILFPDINIHDKKLALTEEAFDLFVLHMYHKVNNLQKELEKIRTVGESKIKAALRASGEQTSQERLDALICLEIEKEKQFLENEFSKKFLAEQKKYDDEMRRQLKLQMQVHADHLREVLSVKEEEMQRNLNRALSEQGEADSLKFKTQMAAVIGKSLALQTALKARMEEEKNVLNAQVLWSACQALARAVKATPDGASTEKVTKPLEPEIKAMVKAAPKEDPLVRATIAGIPKEAATRGVYPEDALRERFLKVEKVAWKLAMIPEGGASLPMYLLSYLQGLLIVKTANPIPKNELQDEAIDVSTLNTYDVLLRARYWLDRGDFKMTLRYMNLLKGAPRAIAREWMNETRILLETQQAVDTLLAYAGAVGLMLLGAADLPQSKQQ